MPSGTIQTPVPPRLAAYADWLICPVCAGPLQFMGTGVVCRSCRRTFGCENEIPLLFWPTEGDPRVQSDVTEVVKAFYERCPFPNYDDVDSSWSLREKAQQGVFARLLDEQIPHGARVLEVGCGTGQLSNFLGLRWGRAVLGTDMCVNSLKLGQAFRERHQIDNVAFLQMNLFRPAVKPASFDLVMCNGVLHHTSDPPRGFQTIARLVKPGGFIVIGLYHAIGRIPTDLRRLVYRVSGNRLRWLDARLRDKRLSPIRRRTWFADQYQHPHESTHTFGEVLGWFHRAGVEFVTSIPKPRAFEPFAADEPLFVPQPPGSRLDRLLVQLGMLLRGGKEGGLFVMIGRKQPGSGATS